MKIFGITGGSGSGKTSASKLLADLGVDVIDTDMIAREITVRGSDCLKELTAFFGDEMLTPDGELKRKTLASIAFSDSEKTKMLNQITHKYIKAEVQNRINASKADLIAIDGAVIIGSNVEPLCDFIVSVVAEKNTRIKRIMERDSLTESQANERLGAQKDEDFYRRHSKFVIENNSTIEDLNEKIFCLYNELKRYGSE